jgi:hypothetical protein
VTVSPSRVVDCRADLLRHPWTVGLGDPAEFDQLISQMDETMVHDETVAQKLEAMVGSGSTHRPWLRGVPLPLSLSLCLSLCVSLCVSLRLDAPCVVLVVTALVWSSPSQALADADRRLAVGAARVGIDVDVQLELDDGIDLTLDDGLYDELA